MADPWSTLRSVRLTSSDDVTAADRKRWAGPAELDRRLLGAYLGVLRRRLDQVPRTGHSPDDYDPAALE